MPSVAVIINPISGTGGRIDVARCALDGQPEHAGLYPAGVICEIMKEDGTMARVPELMKFAKKHGLPAAMETLDAVAVSS